MSDPSKNWPVYAGKSFNIWKPDTGKYYASAEVDTIKAHLQAKRKRQRDTKRSAFYGLPEAVVDDPSTLPCQRPRIAFRDVTNRTNTRTVVSALVPPHVVSVHQAPYLLQMAGTERHEAYVLGVLSSMILDWCARAEVEGHVTFPVLNGFPIPDADVDDDKIAGRVAEIAGRLAAVDERYAEWAAAVGVEVGSVTDDDTKQDLIHELDACVALLYDLDEDDLAVVYDTFHIKTDYSARYRAVLEHYRRWAGETEVSA